MLNFQFRKVCVIIEHNLLGGYRGPIKMKHMFLLPIFQQRHRCMKNGWISDLTVLGPLFRKLNYV